MALLIFMVFGFRTSPAQNKTAAPFGAAVPFNKN